MSGDPSPIVQFPPLFSALLSLFTTVGIDPLDGASMLNAILFAANIYLAGLFVYLVTRMPQPGSKCRGIIATGAPAIRKTASGALVCSGAVL